MIRLTKREMAVIVYLMAPQKRMAEVLAVYGKYLPQRVVEKERGSSRTSAATSSSGPTGGSK